MHRCKLFIPSYHRFDNLATVKLFRRYGWTSSDICVFIDDAPDSNIAAYRQAAERDGFTLVVFNMAAARRRYDYVHRGSVSLRSAGQARNTFQDYAIAKGIDFYCVQDDDTVNFENKHKRPIDGEAICNTFEAVEAFMRRRRIGCFGISQSGDYIGGKVDGKIYLRKVMNCTFYLLPYVYRGERGVQDDDTSMFTTMWARGLFTGSSYGGICLHQRLSAKSAGGLTDLYNECKLLNKALVTVIQYPSAIIAEKQANNGGRLHHRINYRYLAPCLLRGTDISGKTIDNISWDTFAEDMPFTNEPRRIINFRDYE